MERNIRVSPHSPTRRPRFGMPKVSQTVAGIRVEMADEVPCADALSEAPHCSSSRLQRAGRRPMPISGNLPHRA